MTYRLPAIVGDRVALAPHLDLWMAGVRFGIVTGTRTHNNARIYRVNYGVNADGTLVSGRVVWLRTDDLLGAVNAVPGQGLMPGLIEPSTTGVSDVSDTCDEFAEFGTCIHSDHMSEAGL